MKSLTQHITEKLVLNNNTKVKGADSFLDRIEWAKNILDSFSKQYNFDLLNVDFSKDKEVFNNLATIYGNKDNEKLMEYFLHLLMTFEYMEEEKGVGWWGNPENADFYKNMSAQDNPWNFIRVFSGGRMPDMYPCDHAGKYECAMLESLYPGSIKLERLDYSRDWFAEDAKEMDVNTGAELVERAVNSIINAIKTGEKCY